jgi:hypothetical protein
MNASFVRLFDKKADAVEALGYMSGAFPDHDHHLVDTSNQVQIWATIAGATDAKTYGELNDDTIFLVLSLAR